MPSIAELPTPDQLKAAPEWKGLSASDRANVVDEWALQTRAAHPWDSEQTKAIDGALDDFHASAAETGLEKTGRVSGTFAKSAATSLAALPFALPKLGYEEGKAMSVMAGDESPQDKAAVLARVAPDVLKLGQGYERTIEGAKSLVRQHNPLSHNDEAWNASMDALKNDVLDRKLPEDPSQLYDALKQHGLRIAQATAKLHGDPTSEYLPFEYQDIEENGVKRAFVDALSGKRVEGFNEVPDDLHKHQGVTFKNQSRSLVGSPENLGLLMQFSATRNPKYFDALVQRLGRSRTRQQQDADTADLDSQRKEDAMDVAVRNIFGLGGLAPKAGDYMVNEVQGLATSPVDMATIGFSFGLGRTLAHTAESSLARAAGKVALGSGAEFLQGAASALGDESVPTVGNVVEQGLMEAGAGGVIESAGAMTQGAINKATGERVPTPIPAQPVTGSAPQGSLSQIAANAGRVESSQAIPTEPPAPAATEGSVASTPETPGAASLESPSAAVTPVEPVAQPEPQPVKYRTFDSHGRLKETKEAPHAEAMKELRGRESMLQKILDCLTKKLAA